MFDSRDLEWPDAVITPDEAQKTVPNSLDMQILTIGLTTRAGLGLLRRPERCRLLSDAERNRRREVQRALWEGGSQRIVDEGLLADAIHRLPALASDIAAKAWRTVEPR